MKKELKLRAVELRKKGYSLQEIVDILGVSKSTASTWLKYITLSEDAKNRLRMRCCVGRLASQNTLRRQRLIKEKQAMNRAKILLQGKMFTNDMTQIVCSLLYMCEGKKSPYSGVSFMNSDPGLMKLFLNTLRASFSLQEAKFRAQVHLHSYHDKKTQLEFWSKVTGIPLVQFIKPYEKKNSGRSKKEGYQGCANVRYHDVVIARELRAIAQECVKLNKIVFAGPPRLERGTSRLECDVLPLKLRAQ